MVASETGGCEGGRCSGWRVSGRTGAMLGPGGDALSPARVVTASLILAFPNLPPALPPRNPLIRRRPSGFPVGRPGVYPPVTSSATGRAARARRSGRGGPPPAGAGPAGGGPTAG